VASVHGAAAIILDGSGRLLVIKENYDRHRYGFPGGAVEPGEAPEDAVIREVKEETGVEAHVDYLVGTYHYLNTPLKVSVFRCHIVTGTPVLPSTGEIAELGWFAPDALPHPQTNALHYAVPDFLSGARGLVRYGLPRLT
jgi:8-oxo-dGTP diphosphatase